MKKKRYMCPTITVMGVFMDSCLLAGSGEEDRDAKGNGPEDGVTGGDGNGAPPSGGTTAKRYDAWSIWDD